MRLSRLVAGLLVACCGTAFGAGCASTVSSLTPPAPVTQSPDGRLRLAAPMGHAHNDYAQPDPLVAALSAGMLSIEADVFLRDGTLYVAHDRRDIRPGRTLQTLYLDPLWQRFQDLGGPQPGHPFGGAVRESQTPIILMVDIKADGHAAWQALETLLTQYPKLVRHVQHPADTDLTENTDDPPPVTLTPGPVIVVVSGARPIQAITQARARYCGYDGRWPDDAGSAAPAHLMPMLSMSVLTLLELAGQVTQIDSDRPALDTVLQGMAQDAADHGRLARVWATPDAPDTWHMLHTAHLQLINTDTPTRLADWLQTQEPAQAPEAPPDPAPAP